MYEIFAIFIAGVLALMGVSGLELVLSYQRANASHVAAKVAGDYLAQGERDYLGQVATYASNPSNSPNSNPVTSNGSTYTSSEQQICQTTGTAPAGTNTTRTVSVSGANGVACRYYAIYTIQVAGTSYGSSSGEETSYNVNANAGEQRLSAVIVVVVRSAPVGTTGSAVLATKKRTITVRSFSTPPYASIINSSDTQDPFSTSSGTIGGTSGTSEGDVAGNGVGVDTKIYSYSSCKYDTGTNGTQTTMMQSWCNAQNPGTIAAQQGKGFYDPTATTATGAWSAVNTSNFQNQNWNNTANSTNAGN